MTAVETLYLSVLTQHLFRALKAPQDKEISSIFPCCLSSGIVRVINQGPTWAVKGICVLGHSFAFLRSAHARELSIPALGWATFIATRSQGRDTYVKLLSRVQYLAVSQPCRRREVRLQESSSPRVSGLHSVSGLVRALVSRRLVLCSF